VPAAMNEQQLNLMQQFDPQRISSNEPIDSLEQTLVSWYILFHVLAFERPIPVTEYFQLQIKM